jgi:hypothetical protein
VQTEHGERPPSRDGHMSYQVAGERSAGIGQRHRR